MSDVAYEQNLPGASKHGQLFHIVVHAHMNRSYSGYFDQKHGDNVTRLSQIGLLSSRRLADTTQAV